MKKVKKIHLIFFIILLTTPLSVFASSIDFDLPQTHKLTEETSLIGDYFKLKKAEQLIDKDPKLAFTLANRVTEPIFKLWKTIILAEYHLKNEQHRQVLALLKKHPTPPKPELSYGETHYKNLYKRFYQARVNAKKSLGQKNTLDQGYLYAISQEETSSNQKAKQKKTSESPSISLTPEQKIIRLHDLHFRYKFKEIPGVITISEILKAKVSQEEKCQTLYELGNGLRYNKGENENSIKAFEEVTKQKCSDRLYAKSYYWIGKLATYQKNAHLAERAFGKLYKTYPDHRLADDALYHLHKLYKKLGNTHLADKYEKELLDWHTGDMRVQHLFDAAYSYYKDGKYKNATMLLKKALDAKPSMDESYPQAMYWYARSLEKLKSKKKKQIAKKTYKTLINNFPFSFYAVLAANRIGTTVKIPSLPTLHGTAPTKDSEYFVLIDQLNRKGLHHDAAHVLDLALHKNPDWEHNHKEYIARKLIECHNYRKALDIADNHFDSGVYGPTMGSADPLFAAFYPKAYARQTQKGYAHTKLPKGTIEGIMREESLFQRNARSWVGATGLMQLMPTTAKMLKRQQSHFNITDLTDPLSNILLGSTYLKDMKNFFKGELPLAIMAYNAGPGNVKKWLRTLKSNELDEFIEEVPFSETRGYVKRVLRSMQVYGALYHDPFFKKPFLNFEVAKAKQ